MKRRNIIGTDIEVSPICLGTMTFGSPLVETDAIKLVHYAVDNGINFIDTANMYEGYNRVVGSEGGVAEKILGKALKGKRDQVILATKVGMKVGNSPEDDGTSPAAIFKHLDLSLHRLQVDTIDIYYLHRFDPKASIHETLLALSAAINSGKIRYYGISNFSASQLGEFLKVAEENNLPRPVICQPAYSLLKTEAEVELFPLCRKNSIAIAPYQVLQGGLLTGKYRRGQHIPSDSRKAEKKEWVWDLTENIFDQIETINNQAKVFDRTMTQHAIMSVLEKEGVVSVVLGSKKISQLEEIMTYLENVEASNKL